MKKVLILANNSVGLYNFRFELIQKFIKEKFEIYFAVPQLLDDEKVQLLVNAGGRHIHTPMSRRGMNPLEDIKLIKNYKQIIKEVNPDIILTYTIKPNIYGNYIANKFKVPVIMNITGMGSSLITGKLKSVIKLMYKYACSKPKFVFFQNEGNRVFFISNNLVDENKTKIIPGSGVNIEKFQPEEKTNKDNIIRFLFIGRLMKDKGIEEYLQVAEKITKKYSNVEFQILGSFEEEKYKTILENNQNTRIKYLGKSHDVRNEIKEVDCIVNPSYHEGMSNVLLEGGAMGKPLLASSIPGCKEIIDDGENGFLFESKSIKSLKEAIIKFTNLSNEERKVMGEKSRKKIKWEFDRNIVIDEYMKTINSILGEGEASEFIRESQK